MIKFSRHLVAVLYNWLINEWDTF